MVIFALPGKIILGPLNQMSSSFEELLLPAASLSESFPALLFAAALFGAAAAWAGGAGNAFGAGASTCGGGGASTRGSTGVLVLSLPTAHCLKNLPSLGSLIPLQIMATK